MSRPAFSLAAISGATLPLLLDSALKGVALLAVASLIALILWKASAAKRHLVWLVAIVSLLAIPLLSTTLPQWRILPKRTANPVLPSDDPVTIGQKPPTVPSLPAPTPEHPQLAESNPPPLENDSPSPVFSNQGSVFSLEAIPAASSVDPPVSTTRRDWIPLLWISGFAILFLRLLAAQLLLRANSRRYKEIAAGGTGHESITAIYESCLLELGVRHRVTLLLDSKRTIPLAWGVVRPRILLPAEALGWDDDQVRSVLLHELAHLKRRDPLVQWLTQIACALHWWNPLVWLAAWRIHVERERACDDLVLASGVRPSMYAKHLLHVASQLSPAPWSRGCGLAMARKSSLEGRLLAVLSNKLNRRGVSRVLGSVALILGAAVAIPMAMLQAAEETEPEDPTETVEPVAALVEKPSTPVVKKPLRKGAYHKIDAALLRRWERLDGKSDPVPESRLAGLRSAIGRFVDGVDASPYSLTAEQIAELRALQSRDADKLNHSAADATKFVKAVIAIHGEPIQMAFNESPNPGTTRPVEDLEELPFGPAAPDGLRVALLCEKKQFIFGDTARLDLHLWNTGSETLILGIGRDTFGLYPKIELRATGRNGRSVPIRFGPEGSMLKDVRFTKTWQLRPGESTAVYGYHLKVGNGETRDYAFRPAWYTPWHLADVQSGEEITLSASLPYPYAPGTRPPATTMQTGERVFKAIAPEDIEIWSASGAGKWPMPNGVTMEVKQEHFHGADISTSAVLTWPVDATGVTRACTIGLASDAFGNRDPWALAWEKGATQLWTMSGQMRSWRQGQDALATPSSVSRIDFLDRMNVVTTTWRHFPEDLPDGVRAKLLAKFKPLPDEPRNVKEAKGWSHGKQSHDVRPIAELMSGTWKTKGGPIDAEVAFPEHRSGAIEWTIDYHRKTDNSVVTASLSRILSPAENAIGLWVNSRPGGGVDEEDILGKLRRGPNDTLLLDINQKDRHPNYDAATGIVLERHSAEPAKPRPSTPLGLTPPETPESP